MITVPYVPALGPVAPNVLSEELFNAVVDIAETDRFLPYDKDRRWSNAKDGWLIVDKIIHESGRTIIPTLSTRGRGLVKVHCYGDGVPILGEITEWLYSWYATFGVADARIIWFQSVPDGARMRLMLKTFANQDKCDYGRVVDLEDCDVANTFPVSEGMSTLGFVCSRDVQVSGRRMI